MMTVREAAAIFKCAPSTIYRWIGDGRLAAIRLGDGEGRGRMLRLLEDDVHEYLRRVNS
jgi:excisionase family DNA binding protein